MRKEFRDEIDTCIRTLERLRDSDCITINYREHLSSKVRELIKCIVSEIDSGSVLKVKVKYNFPQSLGNLIANSKLPKWVFVVESEKPRCEMDEKELLAYFQNKRKNRRICSSNLLIDEYGCERLVLALSCEESIPIITLLAKGEN